MSSTDNKNMLAWSNEIKKNIMLYPNERVVAFLGRNYKDIQNNSERKALDIGFGSGRHLKLLLDYGFQTFGTDYSEECLKVAKDNLGENELLRGLYNDSFENLNFENDFFDVIFFWGVAFYRPIEDMKKDFGFLFKLLKSGGKMIVNFRTDEDFLYGKGNKVSEETYILNDEYPEYNNIMYTFLDLENAKKLVEESKFKIINIEREDYWKNNLQQKNSWWIFTLEK